jgi:hypothetical protein
MNNTKSWRAGCLSTEVYNVLFATYGRTLTDKTELQFQVNIRHLVVRQRNSMAAVMSVLRMTQDSDQPVLNSPDTLCCPTGWPVCMVGSRFTHTAEANYSPTEGELLGVADALNKTKYFTMGCTKLIVGTDHMPLIGLLADKHIDAIDNPCLVRLEQKTLGWQFTTVYIPGKLLGGTDALSRYGVHHCTDEELQHIVHDNSPSNRQHLIGLMATATANPMIPVIPLLLDTDTHLITSLSSEIRPLTWEEIKQLTSRDSHMQHLTKLVQSSFPASRGDLPPELQQYWTSHQRLSVHDGVSTMRGLSFPHQPDPEYFRDSTQPTREPPACSSGQSCLCSGLA